MNPRYRITNGQTGLLPRPVRCVNCDAPVVRKDDGGWWHITANDLSGYVQCALFAEPNVAEVSA